MNHEKLLYKLNHYEIWAMLTTKRQKHTIHLSTFDRELKQVEATKYLGVYLDDNVNGKKHVDHIISKLTSN